MNSKFSSAMSLLRQIDEEGFGKFKPRNGHTLRPKQLEALSKILFLLYDKDKKYVSLTAPTGSGKSVIAAVLAKITKTIDGYKTNLTTSSRALQAQYGNDLKFDPDFKVVMGTNNYKCSFFEIDGERTVAGKSPCQDDKALYLDWWGKRKPVLHKKDISTLHEDQDEVVLRNIQDTEESVSDVMNDLRGKEPDDSKLLLKNVRKGCKEAGGCSYYYARYAGDKAAVAIRSIQHLLFYVMYQVTDNQSLILPQREVHIHDESHSIESVFRDFFSVQFGEAYYQETLRSINEERGFAERTKNPLEILKDFSQFKKSEGNKWTEDDAHLACLAIERNLESVIVKVVLPKENETRYADKVNTAVGFLQKMGDGTLYTDPDSLSKELRSVIRWYKNIYTANLDQKRFKEAKAKGYRYNKRYGAYIKNEKGAVSVNVYPITLEGMTDRYFGSQRTVFMSATPLQSDIFEKMFGLDGKVGYVEIESDFPTENSPILYDGVVVNTGDMAKELGASVIAGRHYRNVVEQQLAAQEAGLHIVHARLSEKIREIVGYFSNYSGIIPCSSYKAVDLFKEFLEDDPRFIWATESNLNVPSIIDFKRRSQKGEPVFLVSAGIAEGHSFDDDISRIQILPKMPYPARDHVMEDLCKRWGNGYYNAKTAMTLQQMAGRSMRSSEDYCLTILLDKKFEVLKNEKLHRYYSRHFLKCINWEKDWREYSIPC